MRRILLCGALCAAAPAWAQDMDHSHHHETASSAMMHGGDWSAEGSGTSRLPADDAMRGLHRMAGDWMLMAHGYVFGVYSEQGGPRGGDKAYAASMAMLQASREADSGTRLRLRAMLSLDPAMGKRGYPLLFATGETANGHPLIDRQHPHDFLMEVSARLDVPLGGDVTGFVYGGLPGEPAVGPAAFMHRGSARLNPEAPITHHWFDSTHITFGVVTAGLAGKAWQVEASAFKGREPNEERWGVDTPRLDSWAVRGTLNPTPEWQMQFSYARLKSPEALHVDEDEGRLTASLAYVKDGLAVTAAYARKNRMPGPVLEAWLVEAHYDLTPRHALFTRFERVENDELFDHGTPLHGQMFTVSKLSLGYAYTMPLGAAASLSLGGLGSLYGKGDRLDPSYGREPKSFMLFARLALGR